MRKALLDLAEKLSNYKGKRAEAIAKLFSECAENGELWEVEAIYDILILKM